MSATGFRYIAPLLAGLLAWGCGTGDEPDADAFVRLSDESLCNLSFPESGGKQMCSVVSNADSWRVQPMYAGDEAWINVWPASGSGDGGFEITVAHNEGVSPRLGGVNIISGNRIHSTIGITQQGGSEPYVRLSKGHDAGAIVGAAGGSVTVAIDANVMWEAVHADAGGAWISFRDKDAQSVTLTVPPTPLEGMRRATAVFRMVGTGYEDVSVRFEVTQHGTQTDPGQAQKIAIAQLLSEMPGGGVIERNLYVSGWVTSDIRSGNVDDDRISYDANLFPTIVNDRMWVQDDSGRGLLVEFASASANVYELNSRMDIHLTGLTLGRDPASGAMRLSGAVPGSVIYSAPDSRGATPVALTSIADAREYENTLVTLKNVEFAVPVGTYVNINEAGYNKASEGFPSSISMGDTYTQYGHYLRDGQGNMIKLYTCSAFADRFRALMPWGSGDITGIIMKRAAPSGEVGDVVRIRRHNDNKVSYASSSRLSRTVVRFGPFTSTASSDNVAATAGSGTIKSSVYSRVQGASSGAWLYWNWSSARNAPAETDEFQKGQPPLSSSLSVQYPALCCYSWWDAAGSSYSEPAGESWIITTSTAGVAGSMMLTLTTMSSGGGPLYFTVEWAESESAQTWNHIGDFTSVENTATYQLVQRALPLPDAMRNRQAVTLRLRVSSDLAARNSGLKITATGINMIGWLEISEL